MNGLISTGRGKKSIRERERERLAAVQAARDAQMLAFVLLAQAGGEVEVDESTVENVRRDFSRFDVSLEPARMPAQDGVGVVPKPGKLLMKLVFNDD